MKNAANTTDEVVTAEFLDEFVDNGAVAKLSVSVDQSSTRGSHDHGEELRCHQERRSAFPRSMASPKVQL